MKVVWAFMYYKISFGLPRFEHLKFSKIKCQVHISEMGGGSSFFHPTYFLQSFNMRVECSKFFKLKIWQLKKNAWSCRETRIVGMCRQTPGWIIDTEDKKRIHSVTGENVEFISQFFHRDGRIIPAQTMLYARIRFLPFHHQYCRHYIPNNKS